MSYAIPTIASLDQAALEQSLQHKIDNKTKPLGSLGRLESLALRLGTILGTETPQLQAPSWWCMPATMAWRPAVCRRIPVM